MASLKLLSISFLLTFLVSQTFAHSFILAIEGADGIKAVSFGTQLTHRGNLVQNTGIILESEIKSGQVGKCGRVFGSKNLKAHNIDVKEELNMAEASGVPTAYPNGTIHFSVYVANPDGAGPFKCDAFSDESLNDSQPMIIEQQVEGADGVNPTAINYVYALTAAFQPNSTCNAGKTLDNVCIVRCRNPRFGSCMAVRFNPDSRSLTSDELI